MSRAPWRSSRSLDGSGRVSQIPKDNGRMGPSQAPYSRQQHEIPHSISSSSSYQEPGPQRPDHTIRSTLSSLRQLSSLTSELPSVSGGRGCTVDTDYYSSSSSQPQSSIRHENSMPSDFQTQQEQQQLSNRKFFGCRPPQFQSNEGTRYSSSEQGAVNNVDLRWDYKEQVSPVDHSHSKYTKLNLIGTQDRERPPPPQDISLGQPSHHQHHSSVPQITQVNDTSVSNGNDSTSSAVQQLLKLLNVSAVPQHPTGQLQSSGPNTCYQSSTPSSGYYPSSTTPSTTPSVIDLLTQFQQQHQHQQQQPSISHTSEGHFHSDSVEQSQCTSYNDYSRRQTTASQHINPYEITKSSPPLDLAGTARKLLSSLQDHLGPTSQRDAIDHSLYPTSNQNNTRTPQIQSNRNRPDTEQIRPITGRQTSNNIPPIIIPSNEPFVLGNQFSGSQQQQQQQSSRTQQMSQHSVQPQHISQTHNTLSQQSSSPQQFSLDAQLQSLLSRLSEQASLSGTGGTGVLGGVIPTISRDPTLPPNELPHCMVTSTPNYGQPPPGQTRNCLWDNWPNDLFPNTGSKVFPLRNSETQLPSSSFPTLPSVPGGCSSGNMSLPRSTGFGHNGLDAAHQSNNSQFHSAGTNAPDQSTPYQMNFENRNGGQRRDVQRRSGWSRSRSRCPPDQWRDDRRRVDPSGTGSTSGFGERRQMRPSGGFEKWGGGIAPTGRRSPPITSKPIGKRPQDYNNDNRDHSRNLGRRESASPNTRNRRSTSRRGNEKVHLPGTDGYFNRNQKSRSVSPKPNNPTTQYGQNISTRPPPVFKDHRFPGNTGDRRGRSPDIIRNQIRAGWNNGGRRRRTPPKYDDGHHEFFKHDRRDSSGHGNKDHLLESRKMGSRRSRSLVEDRRKGGVSTSQTGFENRGASRGQKRAATNSNTWVSPLVKRGTGNIMSHSDTKFPITDKTFDNEHTELGKTTIKDLIKNGENIVPADFIIDYKQFQKDESIRIENIMPRLWVHSSLNALKDIWAMLHKKFLSSNLSRLAERCGPGLLVTGLPNVNAVALCRALSNHFKSFRVSLGRIFLPVYPDTGFSMGWCVIEALTWNTLAALMRAQQFQWRGICTKIRPLPCPQFIQLNAQLTLAPQRSKGQAALNVADWKPSHYKDFSNVMYPPMLKALETMTSDHQQGSSLLNPTPMMVVTFNRRLHLSVPSSFPLLQNIIPHLLQQQQQQQQHSLLLPMQQVFRSIGISPSGDQSAYTIPQSIQSPESNNPEIQLSPQSSSTATIEPHLIVSNQSSTPIVGQIIPPPFLTGGFSPTLTTNSIETIDVNTGDKNDSIIDQSIIISETFINDHSTPIILNHTEETASKQCVTTEDSAMLLMEPAINPTESINPDTTKVNVNILIDTTDIINEPVSEQKNLSVLSVPEPHDKEEKEHLTQDIIPEINEDLHSNSCVSVKENPDLIISDDSRLLQDHLTHHPAIISPDTTHDANPLLTPIEQQETNVNSHNQPISNKQESVPNDILLSSCTTDMCIENQESIDIDMDNGTTLSLVKQDQTTTIRDTHLVNDLQHDITDNNTPSTIHIDSLQQSDNSIITTEVLHQAITDELMIDGDMDVCDSDDELHSASQFTLSSIPDETIKNNIYTLPLQESILSGTMTSTTTQKSSNWIHQDHTFNEQSDPLSLIPAAFGLPGALPSLLGIPSSNHVVSSRFNGTTSAAITLPDLPTFSIDGEDSVIKPIGKEDEFGFFSVFEFGNYVLLGIDLLTEFLKHSTSCNRLDEKTTGIDVFPWAFHLEREGLNCLQMIETFMQFRHLLPLTHTVPTFIELPFIISVSGLSNNKFDLTYPQAVTFTKELMSSFTDIKEPLCQNQEWGVQCYRFAETDRLRGDGYILLPSSVSSNDIFPIIPTDDTTTSVFNGIPSNVVRHTRQCHSMPDQSQPLIIQRMLYSSEELDSDMHRIVNILTQLSTSLITQLLNNSSHVKLPPHIYNIINIPQLLIDLSSLCIDQPLDTKYIQDHFISFRHWLELSIPIIQTNHNTFQLNTEQDIPLNINPISTSNNPPDADSQTPTIVTTSSISQKHLFDTEIDNALHRYHLNYSVCSAIHFIETYFFSLHNFFSLPLFSDYLHIMTIPKITPTDDRHTTSTLSKRHIIITAEIKRKLQDICNHTLPNFFISHMYRAYNLFQRAVELVGLEKQLIHPETGAPISGPINCDDLSPLTPEIVGNVVDILVQYVEENFSTPAEMKNDTVPPMKKKTQIVQWLMFENEPDWQATARIPSIICLGLSGPTMIMGSGASMPFEFTGDISNSALEAKLCCALSCLRYAVELESQLLNSLGISHTDFSNVEFINAIESEFKTNTSDLTDNPIDATLPVIPKINSPIIPSVPTSWDHSNNINEEYMIHQPLVLGRHHISKNSPTTSPNDYWSVELLLQLQNEKKFRFVPYNLTMSTPQHKYLVEKQVQRYFRLHEKTYKWGLHDMIFQPKEEDVILTQITQESSTVSTN